MLQAVEGRTHILMKGEDLGIIMRQALKIGPTTTDLREDQLTIKNKEFQEEMRKQVKFFLSVSLSVRLSI